jgi:hypothetical protein
MDWVKCNNLMILFVQSMIFNNLEEMVPWMVMFVVGTPHVAETFNGNFVKINEGANSRVVEMLNLLKGNVTGGIVLPSRGKVILKGNS